MNRLRKVFGLDEEYNKQMERYIKDNCDRLLHASQITLIQEDDILFVSQPLQSFKEDCDFCKYYLDRNSGLSTGGTCLKHNVSCGYGFTCKDWSTEGKSEL